MPLPESYQAPAIPAGLTTGFLPAGAGLPLRGLTVLAVEDSRYASDALRLLCQRSGARLRRSESIEATAAHLRVYRPDVAIVDLGLPDGCGADLIRHLSDLRGPLVLAMSGAPEGRAAALAAGAKAFVEKPFPDLADFQALILAHLPGRQPRLPLITGKIAADPMALKDDLARAEHWLKLGQDQARRDYLAGFIAGLARQSDDPELAAASEPIRRSGADVALISSLLRERMARAGHFAHGEAGRSAAG